MPKSVVVVGAGIAGLACARDLAAAGLDVRVFERDQVPGGRLASPQVDGRPVDLGAAYLTVSDPLFAAVVDDWRDRGLARPWTSHFEVYGESPYPADRRSPERWATPGGLAALAADLATDPAIQLKVSYGVPVTDLSRFAGARVVLAMPAPQAAAIHPPFAGVAGDQDWQPAVAVALRYARRCWPDFAGAFVNGHPILATVCDDGDRRGDRAPVLVAHTTAAVAGSGSPESLAGDVEAAVRELMHLPDAGDHIAVRRFREARPTRPYHTEFAQVDGVYLAGDGFGRPRVEAAWLSGRAVAAEILRAENPKSPRTGDPAG